MKLANKIFLLIGSIIAASLAILGAVLATTTKNQLREGVIENLTAESQQIASKFETITYVTNADLNIIGAHKALEDYFTLVDFNDNDSAAKEVDNMESFLRRIYLTKPEYIAFQIHSAKAPVLQITKGERSERFTPFDVASALKRLNLNVTAKGARIYHDFSKLADRLILVSTATLGSQNKIEGLLHIEQDISDVVKSIADLAARRNLQIVIADGHTEIYASAKIATISQQVIHGKSTSGWLLINSHVPQLNWKIYVGIEERVAYSVVTRNVTAITAAIGGTLVVVFFALVLVMRNLVVIPITRVRDRLVQIARGDTSVTEQLRVSTHDEIGELAQAFNEIVTKIHRSFTQIIETTTSLREHSNSVALLAGVVNEGATQTRENMQHAAHAMDNAAQASGEASITTQHAADASTQAQSFGADVHKTVISTLQTFSELASDVRKGSEVISLLEQDSSGVDTIVQVIRQIAEQTNMLALNAAIEAARAGENGRGFAVVADEVRHLSQRTRTSTQEIESIIKRIRERATDASRIMENSHKRAEKNRDITVSTQASIDTMMERMQSVSVLNSQVTETITVQSQLCKTTSDDLNRVTSLATSATQNARSMREAANALLELTDNLKRTIATQFKF